MHSTGFMGVGFGGCLRVLIAPPPAAPSPPPSARRQSRHPLPSFKGPQHLTVMVAMMRALCISSQPDHARRQDRARGKRPTSVALYLLAAFPLMSTRCGQVCIVLLSSQAQAVSCEVSSVLYHYLLCPSSLAGATVPSVEYGGFG